MMTQLKCPNAKLANCNRIIVLKSYWECFLNPVLIRTFDENRCVSKYKISLRESWRLQVRTYLLKDDIGIWCLHELEKVLKLGQVVAAFQTDKQVFCWASLIPRGYSLYVERLIRPPFMY